MVATVMAEESRAGDTKHASKLSFPAAMEKLKPWFINSVMATWKDMKEQEIINFDAYVHTAGK